jgi:hypothetical protein
LLTLGFTALTLSLTPAQSAGAISTLVPVKRWRTTAPGGGIGRTAIKNATPIPMLPAYIHSPAGFRDLALGAGYRRYPHQSHGQRVYGPGAEGASETHAGDPSPHVAGKDTVRRYLTVAKEHGKATLLAGVHHHAHRPSTHAAALQDCDFRKITP